MSNQITVQQAAALHNTTDRQIRQWLRSGKLQGVKDQGGWMVLTDAKPGDVPAPASRPRREKDEYSTPQGIRLTPSMKRCTPTFFREIQLDWGVSDRALQGDEGGRFCSAIQFEMSRRALGLEARHTYGFPNRQQTQEMNRVLRKEREKFGL